MRPNWVLMIYLVTAGTFLFLTVLLAVAAAFARIYAWFAEPVGTLLDEMLLPMTIVSLGILPWPGFLALARSVVRPTKLNASHVQTEPTGSAVAVIIALNEEQALGQVVDDFLGASDISSVIVVDNGSKDRTRQIGKAAGARVVVEGKRGYGFACIRGLKEGLASGHDAIVLCEGDSTFRAADVKKLMGYLAHADLVIGSRTHVALLNVDSQLNSFTTLGNLFVAKLLQIRYWDWIVGGRVRLTDVGCTYRAIRANALRKVLPALQVGGNHFGPHMVMVALEHGLSVVEVPVTFWKRVGASKGGNASWRAAFVLGLQMIWHILTHHVRPDLQPDTSAAETLRQAPSRLWR